MNENDFFLKNSVFTTREFSFTTATSLDVSARKLNRLAQNKKIIRITRGVWIQPNHPYYSPYSAVPKLLGNEQGYISFLTSLHRHGVISQIPETIQIATTGHGRILKSPIGTFEFFKIKPSLMRSGIEVFSGKSDYNLATAEKALCDTLYLSTRKGKRFYILPEIEKDLIKLKDLKQLLKAFSPKLRIAMEKKLSHLL